uniref:Uncharacterized protein n=1 Tax=Panagrolaimus sp. JU765 TaxID=591449 RepID=A0AC34QSV1_9BILA
MYKQMIRPNTKLMYKQTQKRVLIIIISELMHNLTAFAMDAADLTTSHVITLFKLVQFLQSLTWMAENKQIITSI